MRSISKEDVLARLRWRYATKKFDPNRKIPEEEWEVLEQSLMLSPSSFGLEPWRFFIIVQPEIRTQLISAAWNQPQVAEASHLVALAAKRGINLSDVDALIERTAKIRSVSPTTLDGFKRMLTGFINNLPQSALDEWAIRQVYIALGQFVTTAALLGIDTCPMEGFVPEQVDEILGLKNSGYGTVLLCSAGYRWAGDKTAQLAKVRHKPENVIVRI